VSGSFPQKRNAWVAIVAAYILLLQAVLGSPMLGAAADPLRVGAFGVICSTTGAGAEADQPGLPQHHLPDCCLNGCLMSGMAALPGAETAPFVAPSRLESSAIPPAADVALSFRRDHTANPRAPPMSA